MWDAGAESVGYVYLIMISSELPEVLGMSNRVYAMNERRIVGEFPIAEATSEAIMARILQTSGKGVS